MIDIGHFTIDRMRQANDLKLHYICVSQEEWFEQKNKGEKSLTWNIR